MPLVECLDVGGTTIRYALIQDEKILFQNAIPSVQGNMGNLAAVLHAVAIDGRAHVRGMTIDSTVVGLPGPVQGDMLLNSAPLEIAQPASLSPIREKFPAVRFFNDLNLAVRGEHARGAGMGLDSFALVGLSTGIGVGMVWQGRVLEGPVGEFGHSILDARENAPACALPHRGCWASFSSGAGIARRATAEWGRTVSTEEVFVLAAQEDARAEAIVSAARAANAQGLGTLLNAVGVQKLVFMGSVALNHFSRVIPEKSEVARFTIHPVPSMEKASLGEDAGLWGAYFAGREK